MALLVGSQLGFSEEASVSKAIDSTLEKAKTEAVKVQTDLTKLAKDNLEVGKEKLKSATKTSVEKAKTVTNDLTAKASGAVEKATVKTQSIAKDLEAKASNTLQQGKEKLQLLMDLGDTKSLNEAKTYVLSKLKGIPQSEAVADLLKRGVKGFGPWLEKAKVEAGSKMKMKLAYYSRYVDEPGVAKTLKKWMNEDADPLVQEYCARALGHQSTGGVLDSLKTKLTQENLSGHVKKALESSIALLAPPETGPTLDASVPLPSAPVAK